MTTSFIIISLFLLSLFFTHLIILSAQQPPDLVYRRCFNSKGTYTKSSPYRANLIKLLSNLISDQNNNESGFYTSSLGESLNTVYAQGLCRADSDEDTCRSCLINASIILPSKCPNQKQAFGYYDYCTLQYSSSSMSGQYLDPSFSYSFNNPEVSVDGNSFTRALKQIMQKLKSDASGDGLKAATGSEKASENEIVYGLAQCTPDLSQQDCSDCLDDAIKQIPDCCANKVGGRVIKLSCNLRFEKVCFYNM